MNAYEKRNRQTDGGTGGRTDGRTSETQKTANRTDA